jgi:small-conductance mechanosensitive channel
MRVSPLLKQLGRRTGILFVIFVAARILPLILDLPPQVQEHFQKTFHITIDKAFYSVAIVALFFQALRWTDAFIDYWREVYTTRHRAEYGAATTIHAVATLIQAVIVVFLILSTLGALGFQVTPLIAGLGIGGVAVAFALQNVLSDLFGALSIVFDKPFVIGDAIQVDQFSGRVERIGLQSTRLRSDTGELVVFANSELLKGRIRNFQLMQERRVVLITRVAGDTAPDLLSRIPPLLEEIVQAQPTTRFDRSHCVGFGDTTINFETVYFLTDTDSRVFMNTQQAIHLAAMRRLAAEGIVFGAQLEAYVKKKTAGLR